MRRSSYRALVVLVATTILVIGCSSPTRILVEIETLMLDSYGASGMPTVEGPVLADGADYVLTVEGTFSAWDFSATDPGWCKGTQEAAPRIPSPGRTNGLVMFDANARFAVHPGDPKCSDDEDAPYPTQIFRISLDGGSTFDYLPPTSSAFDANHTYTYAVVGTGERIAFRMVDATASDNYGMLRIKISGYQ